MVTVKKIALLLMLVPALTACKEKPTYSYLMRHPAYLHEENMRCDRMVSKTSEDVQTCAEIKRANMDFMTLLNDQQMDPEAFGKRVMQAERECVAAMKTMEEAKHTLETQQQAGQGDLPLLEKNYWAAKLSYKEKHTAVQQLLVVIGTHSPE